MGTLSTLALAAALRFLVPDVARAPEAVAVQSCGRPCACDKITCKAADGASTERPGCSVTCPETECAACTCEATCDDTVRLNECGCR